MEMDESKRPVRSLPPSKPPPARHRPGARSARRQRCPTYCIADHIVKETPMWFRSLFQSVKPRRAGRLRVEALEDRSVPAVYLETDPTGDFLPGYTGAHDPGMDVVSYEAVLVGDHVVFAGEMAGPIAPTQAIG